jgi:hypothetical protein
VDRFRKDLVTSPKELQSMAIKLKEGTCEEWTVSYTLKVMLFCLALTMCIIGVSHQFGLSLTN